MKAQSWNVGYVGLCRVFRMTLLKVVFQLRTYLLYIPYIPYMANEQTHEVHHEGE